MMDYRNPNTTLYLLQEMGKRFASQTEIDRLTEDIDELKDAPGKAVFYVSITGADGVYEVDSTPDAVFKALRDGMMLLCRLTFSEGSFGGENTLLPPIMVLDGYGVVFSGMAGADNVVCVYTIEGTAVQCTQFVTPETMPQPSIETDETLTFINGVLSVNTASNIMEDNTLPITSAAVYTTVGNIEALLGTI